jgi:hypothetical protein
MAAFRSRRRHGGRWWSLGVTAVVAVVFVVFFVASSGAVLNNSPSSFEANDGNMIVGTANNSDWNCFAGHATGFQPAAGINVGLACSSNVVFAGALAKTDPAATTSDDSWVNGQKMDSVCAQLATNKNPAKDDFTSVATYSETASNKHTFLYGATIRVAPNGNASENVELNQVAGTTACPITRTAGDRLLAFDYLNGGTNLNLHVLTWITPDDLTTTVDESKLGGNNGICVIKNDTMPCFGANVLTPSTTSFEGQASQATINAGDNGISGQLLAAGTFAEFGVDLTTALGQSTTACNTFAQTVWESRSSGSSFSSNPEDISVENKTISNCGGIIIRKVTSPTPDGPDTSFSFSDNVVASDTFTLKNGGNKDFGSSVQAGSYSVSETPHAGYTLSNIDCSASSKTNGSTTTIGTTGGFDAGDASISISLVAGDSIDCTYTNTLQTAGLGTSVSDSAVVPGAQVRDTATVTGSVSTLNPGGNVTFYLCSFGATSTDVCDGTTGHVGTALSPVSPLGGGSGGVSTATSPYVNTVASPRTAGRYCFRAEWPGDTNYPGALKEWGGTSGTGECFTVSKIDTSTVTTPNDGTHLSTAVTTITLGSSIYDTAVVTGTSAGGDPDGTVTFSVCKLASGTCTTGGNPVGDATTSVVALVPDGSSSTFTSSATSVAYTPASTGRYCFRGDYSGSTVYNTSSDSNSNECFVVTDTTTSSSTQTWLPNDSASVSADHGAKLNGSLTIQLYTGGTCAVGNAVANHSYSQTLTDATTGTVTSANTDYTVSANASVSWKVTFASTDTNVTGSSHCESSSLTITN